MTDKHTQLDHLVERIDALEARNAFQDDVIEQLNQELAIHQQHIAELQEHIQLIAQRIKSNANNSIMARPEDEPPPPHY
ncbi:protein SlyX [Thalassotalea loyana]|uniref:Protein SlyX homolog n=1 Tax=Thalassotalea loyana TaxID=280483 RepID=A0ABQ6H769_9GAMM|nr:SlyX family protein [Thalassotalea loyana]GLX83982.1 protein SlyX [Thalassotalea loyana]